MIVKMLKTIPGADDGVTLSLYREGETYDISERLAKIFFAVNAAEESKPVVNIVKEKNAGQAPENKMMKSEERKDKRKE